MGRARRYDDRDGAALTGYSAVYLHNLCDAGTLVSQGRLSPSVPHLVSGVGFVVRRQRASHLRHQHRWLLRAGTAKLKPLARALARWGGASHRSTGS